MAVQIAHLQAVSGNRRWISCLPQSGMQSLALICMLLTVGTIVVPRGDRGVDGLVAIIAKQAQDYTAQRSSMIIARLDDKRQCRPVVNGANVPRVNGA